MITDNGLVRPTPPVTRALRQIRSALEAAGHRVVEWEPYAAAQSMGILGAFFSGDGGHTLASVINESGEDWPRGLQFIKAMYEKSKDSPRSVGETWITQQKRNDYVKKALDHWEASVEVTGTGRPFDGVISPTSPFSAPPKWVKQPIVTETASDLRRSGTGLSNRVIRRYGASPINRHVFSL